VVLSSTAKTPAAIAVDATSVYWIERYGGVMKLDIAGGTPKKIASETLGIQPALALDSTSVYYVDNALGPMKVPASGGSAPKALYSASFLNVFGIGVDSTSVYLLTMVLEKVPIAGGLWSEVSMQTGLGMAMGVGNIFLTDQPTRAVLQVPTTGAPAATLASGDYPAPGIAADATNVYFTYPGQGTVVRVPIGGGALSTLASGGADANSMAVDHESVYWTDNTKNAVMKAPIDGGPMSTLAMTGQSPPFGLAVTATTVYWTVPVAGTVMKLAK
jgi:hypothetical protein